MLGGGCELEGDMGMYVVMTPFFGRSALPIAYFFFAKISALKTQIFQIVLPKIPHFSRKICSLDPTRGNLCSAYPPKEIEYPGF